MPDPTLYFDKVKLLDGSIAEVCDSTARAAIQGGTYFLGVTTTALTDGSTTNPIVIAGNNVTAENGNVVAYGNKEFVWASVDSKWHELGDLTNLGALALKDSASGTYTPAGSVSKPDVDVTPTTATIAEFASAGSVTAGTANVPTVVAVTAGTADVPSEVDVTPGTANVPTSVTLPTLTTTLNGTTLELGWTAGSVTAGTAGVPTVVSVTDGVAGVPTAVSVTPGTAGVPTAVTLPTSKNTSVVTGVAAELHEAPAFTGTQATITVS